MSKIDNGAKVPGTAQRRCPICGRTADPAMRPFCSRRCADVDLARWFGETYRVPAADEEPDGDDEPEPGRT